MEFKEFIGVDVGKFFFDVCIHTTQMNNQFEANANGFKSFLKWAKKNIKAADNEVLIIMEHTGNYSLNLAVFLEEKNIKFTIVPSLEIKKSIGLVRGKSDKIDAQRIAQYAYRRRDEIKETHLPGQTITKIKQLVSSRALLVKQKKGLTNALKELKGLRKERENKDICQSYQRLIKSLNAEIKALEKKMLEIIKTDEAIKTQFDLICSIKGVGALTAAHMIVVTEGFQKFNKARQFASYCGVAPFPYSSGTSIKGRNKVSNFANKEIKSLIHLCALSSKKYSAEMKIYYDKKVNEGKHKMTIINAIRNKLIQRIFAVINRGTPYVDTYKFAA